MPELVHSKSSGVFPFPPTPKFKSLTEVCRYLNYCGFDITWQSFHRTYKTYIDHHDAIIRQQMRAHGIEADHHEEPMHDKISMLIVRDMLDLHLREILVKAIQQRAYANRIQTVQRLYRYAMEAIPPQGTTRQQMMLAHLDAVLEAIIDSLDSHHGGETNQGYLDRLYRSSISSSMASVSIMRRPEQWFVIMENQHDLTIDVVVPRFARSYATLFTTFNNLLDEDREDLNQTYENITKLKDLDRAIKAICHRGGNLVNARQIVEATEEERSALLASASSETLELVSLLKEKNQLRASSDAFINNNDTTKVVKEIRAEMKKTLMSFGCSSETEKKIYRACAELVEDLDSDLISPEDFHDRIYDTVREELTLIAQRSVVDSMAHAAILDFKVADFISELFNIDRKSFERHRFNFAKEIARHLGKDPRDSDPQSSSCDDEEEAGASCGNKGSRCTI